MKFRLHIILFSIFFCVGCGKKYQVFQVVSEETKQEFDGTFLSENGDLSVRYDFWSYGGTVWLDVINVSEEGLYLLISESDLIINEERLPHLRKSEMLAARADPNYMPQPSVYLAPKESYGFESYPIVLKRWKFSSKMTFLDFQKEGSPFQIKSQLVYSSQSDFSQKDTLIDDFWVNSVQRMSGSDFQQQQDQLASSSHFFVFKDNTQFWMEVTLGVLNTLLLFAF